MSKITFTVFADYHYYPDFLPCPAEGMDIITKRAHDSHSDVIVSLGDFMRDSGDTPVFEKMAKNKYGIPFIGCYGNHELERMPSFDLLNAAYGQECGYFTRDIAGYRFIVLDTNNYRDENGVLIHYKGWSWGGVTHGGKDSNAIGDEQLAFLKENIDSSPYPCIIVSHVSFLYDSGASEDAGRVRAIINAANEKSPRKVIMCLNGHYHSNGFAVRDNVAYFNVNVTYIAGSLKEPHGRFPKEFAESSRDNGHSFFYSEPLSATVTVEDGKVIDIKGMETGYMYGVAREDYDLPEGDRYGRYEPRISDSHAVLE